MSSIIAFYGSARKNSVSNRLVDQVVSGAKSAGANVISYDLNDKEIMGCQGCMWCRSHEGCSTKDKLHPFYEQIKTASGIVVGFPIYMKNISGQTKQWLDRMYPLMGEKFAPRYPGKKCAAIYAYGNPNEHICDSIIADNNQILGMDGFDIINTLVGFGTAIPGYEIPDKLMSDAFDAGKSLI